MKVYSISRKRNADFPLERKGDEGLVFRVFDTARFNPGVIIYYLTETFRFLIAAIKI